VARSPPTRTNVPPSTASAGMIGDDSRNHVYTDRVNVDLVQSVNSDTGATRPIQITAIASGNDRLDLQGHLRDDSFDPTKNTWVVPINSITAGITDDIQLQAAQQDSGVGTVGGINVALNGVEVTDSDPAKSNPFYNFYTPDTGSPAGQDLGVYAKNSTPIASTYDFQGRNGDGSLNGKPGLVAGTGNILVNAADPDPSATQINVTGITDILGTGTGWIDVKTNGFITLTEFADDMRVGKIESTANNVTLTSPASIIDANPDDLTAASDPADVIGVNITLTALGGTIGTPANLLETHLPDPVAGKAQSGVLTATTTGSAGNIYIDEVDGNLRVNTVIAQHGDVVLTTRNGSILDSNSDTTTDRDGRTVGVPNVVGINLSFAA